MGRAYPPEITVTLANTNVNPPSTCTTCGDFNTSWTLAQQETDVVAADGGNVCYVHYSGSFADTPVCGSGPLTFDLYICYDGQYEGTFGSQLYTSQQRSIFLSVSNSGGTLFFYLLVENAQTDPYDCAHFAGLVVPGIFPSGGGDCVPSTLAAWEAETPDGTATLAV